MRGVKDWGEEEARAREGTKSRGVLCVCVCVRDVGRDGGEKERGGERDGETAYWTGDLPRYLLGQASMRQKQAMVRQKQAKTKSPNNNMRPDSVNFVWSSQESKQYCVPHYI